MASTISLGFRPSKYTHPIRDENASKPKPESKGWAPIRQVIAIAEERHRNAPLAVSLQTGAAYHAASSKRLARSIRDLGTACDSVKPSSKKRILRLRQTMPALQG